MTNSLYVRVAVKITSEDTSEGSAIVANHTSIKTAKRTDRRVGQPNAEAMGWSSNIHRNDLVHAASLTRSIPLYAPKFRDNILRPVLRAMIDARDFNGVLFYLIDDNVRRKNQVAPPAHASGTAAMGKILQRS